MFKHWILIGLLSTTTYISRFFGLEMMAGRNLSPTLRLYFSYAPIGILSALIVKQVLVPAHGKIAVSIPVFIGCLSAAIAIKMTKKFLPSVIIGSVIGLVVRYFNGFGLP